MEHALLNDVHRDHQSRVQIPVRVSVGAEDEMSLIEGKMLKLR